MDRTFFLKYPWLDSTEKLISPLKIGYTFEEFLSIAPSDFIAIIPEVKTAIVNSIQHHSMLPKINPQSPEHVVFFTMLCATIASINDVHVSESIVESYAKYSRGIIEDDRYFGSGHLDPDRLLRMCHILGFNFKVEQTRIKSDVFCCKMNLTDYLHLVKTNNKANLLPENLAYDDNYVFLRIPDIISWLEFGCQKRLEEIIQEILPQQRTKLRDHLVFGQAITQIESIAQKTLKERAQSDRTESEIEAIFWNAVKDANLGIEIQFPIGIYRADFAIPDLKIVIECDSQEYHSTAEARTKDAKRNRILKAMKWTVIPFTGSEIKQDVQKCVQELKTIVAKYGPISRRTRPNNNPSVKLVKKIPFIETSTNSKEEYEKRLSIADLIQKHIMREMYSSLPAEFPHDLYSTIQSYIQNSDQNSFEYKKTISLALTLFQARLSRIRQIFSIPLNIREIRLRIRCLPEEEKIFANKAHEIISTWYQTLQNCIRDQNPNKLKPELQLAANFLTFQIEFSINKRREEETLGLTEVPFELYSTIFASMNFWKNSDDQNLQYALKRMTSDLEGFISCRFKKLLRIAFSHEIPSRLLEEEKSLVITISNLYKNWIRDRS